MLPRSAPGPCWWSLSDTTKELGCGTSRRGAERSNKGLGTQKDSEVPSGVFHVVSPGPSGEDDRDVSVLGSRSVGLWETRFRERYESYYKKESLFITNSHSDT